jgi:diguanylate cyclase
VLRERDAVLGQVWVRASRAVVGSGERIRGPAAVSVSAAAGVVLLLCVIAAERVAASRRHRRDLAGARRLARTDDLTGLANRRALLARLTEALTTGRPFVLLLIDLDGFKAVNDTYGHHTGDLVLQEVAGRLTQATGETGLVARLGGDEFAVLTHQTRAALTDPVAVGPYRIRVSASTGVTTQEPGDVLPTDLLARADAAMYRAKPVPPWGYSSRAGV